MSHTISCQPPDVINYPEIIQNCLEALNRILEPIRGYDRQILRIYAELDANNGVSDHVRAKGLSLLQALDYLDEIEAE